MATKPATGTASKPATPKVTKHKGAKGMPSRPKGSPRARGG